MKYEVGFIINDEQYMTVIEARDEALAFCLARNRAEREYHNNGIHCTSIGSITCAGSYVKEYVDVEIDFNDPIFDLI